jgi:hypothetical protein
MAATKRQREKNIIYIYFFDGVKKTNYDAASSSPKIISYRTTILTTTSTYPAPYIPPTTPGTCGTVVPRV